MPHCGLRVGPKRFNEMRRMIPAITHRRLTRTIFPVVPPHVNPTLSDLGVSQMPVLTAMANRGAALSANATEHAA